MTAEIPGELLESLRCASASMADIRALAEKLGRLSPGQIEPVLQGLLDAGEDRALSRLLPVCAFDGVKLDPRLLCGCLGVCEDLLDLAPCFALQDESADRVAAGGGRCRGIAGRTAELRRPAARRADGQVQPGPATGAQDPLEARACRSRAEISCLLPSRC